MATTEFATSRLAMSAIGIPALVMALLALDGVVRGGAGWADGAGLALFGAGAWFALAAAVFRPARLRLDEQGVHYRYLRIRWSLAWGDIAGVRLVTLRTHGVPVQRLLMVRHRDGGERAIHSGLTVAPKRLAVLIEQRITTTEDAADTLRALGASVDAWPSFPSSPRSEMTLDAYLAEYGALPEPDRTHITRNRFVSRGQADIGTWSSVIVDGDIVRPMVVETWAEEGNITSQTCFFSRIGLEDETCESVLAKFRASGSIVCQDATPCELIRVVDARGHPIWSFNICIGTDDTLYVRKSFPYRPFPEDAFPS